MKQKILCLVPALLALAGGPVAYFLLLKVPWIRNTALPNIFILFVAAGWAVVQFRQEYSAWTAASLVLTLAIAAGFIYLRFGLSSLPEANLKVAVGNAAPDFSLADSEGKEFALSSLRGKEKIILVFFRGVW